MSLVDNVAARREVAAFAANPDQRRAYDVLRVCMYGDLLFDTTGSSAFADPAQPFRAGSELRIAAGSGPDGGRALFAFTCQAEIDRRHPAGTATLSLVTPAVDALGLARRQGDAWLYLDPAGPTCALSAAEMDFALRNPNNAPLKEALDGHVAGRIPREAVLDLVRADGPVLLAADESTPGGPVTRTVTHTDGSIWLVGFTSAPEIIAVNPQDAVAAFRTGEVLSMIRDRGYRGLVLNPAGPWIGLRAGELFR